MRGGVPAFQEHRTPSYLERLSLRTGYAAEDQGAGVTVPGETTVGVTVGVGVTAEGV